MSGAPHLSAFILSEALVKPGTPLNLRDLIL